MRNPGAAHAPLSGVARPLSALPAGAVATIHRVVSDDPGRLVRLSSLGLMPGARVRLVQKRPAIVLEIGATTVAIDRELAQAILMEPA